MTARHRLIGCAGLAIALPIATVYWIVRAIAGRR